MRKRRSIIPVLVVMFVLIGSINYKVFAAYAQITNLDLDTSYVKDTSLFVGYGVDSEVPIDYTTYEYLLDDRWAYCIEAGKMLDKGEYSNNGETTNGLGNPGALSYVMYAAENRRISRELAQAAVWKLTPGNTVEALHGNMADLDNLINEANNCNNGIVAPNATIFVENGDYSLKYDKSLDAYVSNKIIVSNGTTELVNPPAGTKIESYYDGVRIIVPANSVTGDVSFTLRSNCTTSAQIYGAAEVWRKPDSQTIIVPRMETIYGQGTEATFNLTAVGSLKLLKVDEHGNNVQGATFLVTGGPDNVSFEITTNYNGVAEIDNLRVGDYTISEIYAPGNLYIPDSTQDISYKVKSGYTNTIQFEAENDYKRGQTQLKKYDLYWGDSPKGDSKLEGARYGLYAAEDIYEGDTLIFRNGEKITEVTTDVNGYTPVVKEVYSMQLNKTIDGLPVGSYYWKELYASEGYNINEEIIDVEVENDNDDMYAEDLGLESVTQSEEGMTGRGRVVKYNNDKNNDETENDTDKEPSTGAVLRLRLISAIGTDKEERNTYYATIDENGYAEFIDEEYKELNPDDEYTIPYGVYEIDEVRASNNGTHTYFFMNPEQITIDKDHKEEFRIVADEPISAYLKIIKKDSESKEEVHIAGGKYMIWDCTAGEFVSQMVSPSGNYINVFETNDEGYLYTPQKLYAGDYIVYEVEAPEGYYLDETYRLPENEADYGDVTKGGVKVTIDTIATGIEDGTIYDPDLNLTVDVEIYNTVLKAQLNIQKKGEVLTGATSSTVEYKVSDSGATEKEEKFTPVYTLQGLPDVEYQIIAENDILSPDGRYTYVYAGDVVDTILTDDEGYAQTKPLYLGEYRIVETSAPEGYLVDKNIENVILENNNEMVAVETYDKELENVRQKLKLTFNKKYEENIYSDSNENQPKALFGVYTKQVISNSKGEIIIPNNKLVDLIWTDDNNEAISNIDLPEGTYYVKELYVSYPYTVSQDTIDFVLEYNKNSEQEVIVVEGPELINTYDSASITLLKIASTTLDNIILNGDKIDTSELDEKTQDIINNIKGMTKDEIKEYFKNNNVKFVSGAKYGIYVDEECTNPLKIKNNETGNFEEAIIVTDDTGIIELDNLPLGEYYIKEIEAPNGYELSDEVTKITLDISNKDTMIYQALVEEDVIEALLTKIDVFTGEAIEDCVFEIRDEDGELLLKSVTDGQGVGYIPVSLFENGKKYTYTEVKAPDIYELNTEPHEFVASYDEETYEWTGEEIVVENLRKDSTVTFEKLDAMDSTPIPNCKFELKSLETDFVVTGVTDENGVYVFENVPYGRYTYTELEAPEEYLIDTTPHEITISEEQTRVVVTNERAPETGDMTVMMVTSVAIVSVIGIAFVMIKNKKRSNI